MIHRYGVSQGSRAGPAVSPNAAVSMARAARPARPPGRGASSRPLVVTVSHCRAANAAAGRAVSQTRRFSRWTKARTSRNGANTTPSGDEPAATERRTASPTASRLLRGTALASASGKSSANTQWVFVRANAISWAIGGSANGTIIATRAYGAAARRGLATRRTTSTVGIKAPSMKTCGVTATGSHAAASATNRACRCR